MSKVPIKEYPRQITWPFVQDVVGTTATTFKIERNPKGQILKVYAIVLENLHASQTLIGGLGIYRKDFFIPLKPLETITALSNQVYDSQIFLQPDDTIACKVQGGGANTDFRLIYNGIESFNPMW